VVATADVFGGITEVTLVARFAADAASSALELAGRAKTALCRALRAAFRLPLANSARVAGGGARLVLV